MILHVKRAMAWNWLPTSKYVVNAKTWNFTGAVSKLNSLTVELHEQNVSNWNNRFPWFWGELLFACSNAGTTAVYDIHSPKYFTEEIPCHILSLFTVNYNWIVNSNGICSFIDGRQVTTRRISPSNLMPKVNSGYCNMAKCTSVFWFCYWATQIYTQP